MKNGRVHYENASLTYIPEEVRIYSNDDDVTDEYETELSDTGWLTVWPRKGGPSVTAFSTDGPAGHGLRHRVDAPWFPWDGSTMVVAGPMQVTA